MILEAAHIDINDIPEKRGWYRREETALNLFKDHAVIPQTIDYRDIDGSFKKWVEDDLSITFDGQVLPTTFMVAAQRLNEYGQEWKFTKDGGLLMNFKTVTREPNPQQGTQYGGIFNIPTDAHIFEVARIPVNENGIESWDVLKMKQPMQIDLTYSVSIFSTHFSLLNDFNRMVHDKFKAIECYLNVNGHYVSMELENVSDESQYSLEDRKFFSQTFQITVKAYIITPEDFKRERMQSRMVVSIDTETKNRPFLSFNGHPEGQSEVMSILFESMKSDSIRFRLEKTLHVYDIQTENIRNISMKRDNEVFVLKGKTEFTLHRFEKIFITIRRKDDNRQARINMFYR
jgi:hypothetical protein